MNNQYSDALTSDAAKVLYELISTAKFLRNFVFVGGSALAMYLHHRKSEDLDFFTWDKEQFNKRQILQYIDRFNEKEILNEDADILDLRLNTTKVTFFNAGWKFLKPDTINNFNIASLEAIASMKIHVLFLRAKYRDYYDLYFITKKIGVKNIFNMAKNAIPGLTLKLFCMALLYIDDIEDDSIAHLEPVEVISKKEIRNFLQECLLKEGLLL
ncbi:MAG TPA: nucleotidyl transferase AbiEii/AbiGii toxin family protein [Spirochaetota bacterium]|nr:nucleotidyl transferase AbiEii/AbiGii toxin family protein [Spirochaetota bacterium]HOM09019.1 nucleotidyl transferase AbiEii/AbiGii toxin family protein [Spirochaetota bacterium]HPP48851.1 nucleotidyl transferase AbiEii/AbiGii toxin family protein [Spirochaetota bacterium]